MTRRVLAAVATLLLLLLSTTAFAQKKETSEQRRAKALFEEGIALSDEGKWAEALSAFQRSDELAPSPSVRFNIGATLRALGRYVEAKSILEEILTRAEKTTPPPKPAFLAEVKKLLGEVYEKIVVLELKIDPADAELEVDGAKPVPLPDGRLELDPGKHVFVVRAKGHETTTVSKNLTHEDTELVLKAPRTQTQVVEKRVEVKVEEDTPFYQRFWFWTAAGAVVAGAVVVTVIVTRPDTRDPAAPPPSTVDRPIPVSFRF